MADTGNGLIQEQGRGPQGRDGTGSAGAFCDVPDTGSTRLQKRVGGGSNNESLQPACWSESASHDRALFPPGPADRERWAAIIRERPDLAPAVESEVRGMAAGASRGMDFSRVDQLRSLGNLVVPLQGAVAFTLLRRRAGVTMFSETSSSSLQTSADSKETTCQL